MKRYFHEKDWVTLTNEELIRERKRLYTVSPSKSLVKRKQIGELLAKRRKAAQLLLKG